MQSKQNVLLDQFYTKKEEAKRISDFIKSQEWFSEVKRVIEPSAGEGSFSDNFECIAYDIDPKKEYIIKTDFLKEEIQYEDGTLCVGNPPFGRNSSLAISFIRKCSEISDYVAFILPLSFTKKSLTDKVPRTHSLIYQEVLDPKSFYIPGGLSHDVKCIFQIWKREQRVEEETIKGHPHFRFVKISDNPDFLMKRVGGKSGEISEDLNSYSGSGSYYIKCNIEKDTFLNNFRSINWNSIASNSVGPKSLSKFEVLKEYAKMFPNT